MKATLHVLMCSCLLVVSQTQASSLYDDFNATTIDTSLWSISLPWPDSTATEGGGVTTIRNRGGLVAQSEFFEPYEVTGRFALTGSIHDLFRIAIRTTGTTELYPSREFDDGIWFSWLKYSDPGSIENIVSIDVVPNGYPSAVNLALTHYNFDYNQFYNFKITDDGNNVTLYFDDMDTPLLSISDSTVMGHQVGFHNREGGGAGSWISNGSEVQMDYFSVTTVPEPGTFTLMVAVAVMFLLCKRANCQY